VRPPSSPLLSTRNSPQRTLLTKGTVSEEYGITPYARSVISELPAIRSPYTCQNNSPCASQVMYQRLLNEAHETAATVANFSFADPSFINLPSLLMGSSRYGTLHLRCFLPGSGTILLLD